MTRSIKSRHGKSLQNLAINGRVALSEKWILNSQETGSRSRYGNLGSWVSYRTLLYSRAIRDLWCDDQYVFEEFRFKRRRGAVEFLPPEVGIALHDLGRNVADLGADGPAMRALCARLNPDSFAYATVEHMM